MWVVLFSLWPSLPVYHDGWGGTSGKDDDGVWRARTRCGRVYYDVSGNVGDLMPRRHARKFGRPCSVCFPQGDAA